MPLDEEFALYPLEEAAAQPPGDLEGSAQTGTVEWAAEDSEVAEEFLDEPNLAIQLDLLQNDRIIDAVERELLNELYRGIELSECASRIRVRTALRSRHMTIDALLADIQRRVDGWQSNRRYK